MSTPAQELLTAVAGGDADRVAALLTTDPQLCDFADRTELRQPISLHAAAQGNVAIVELLLIAGANVTKYDSVGNTALIHAAGAGHLAIVQLLVQHGDNSARQLAKAASWARRADPHDVPNFLSEGHRDVAQFLQDRLDAERRRAKGL